MFSRLSLVFGIPCIWVAGRGLWYVQETCNLVCPRSWAGVGVKWKSLSHVRLFVTPWTIQSMKFSRPEYWSGQPFPSPGDLPNPGIELRSPTLQVFSLPAEPQGKPKNTGVGSLSLLQGIFLTQESNWGLLHCRQILYQLSYPLTCALVIRTFALVILKLKSDLILKELMAENHSYHSIWDLMSVSRL